MAHHWRILASRCAGPRAGAFHTGRWFLEAIGAHRAKPRIGDELAALLMLMIAVHEGVFFGLPVEALELFGNVILAHARGRRVPCCLRCGRR